MFYEFQQNNSGGSFITDEDAGLGVTVYVEANSAEEANDKAERIGIYFNGCDDGIDCDCCGDRWYSVDESDWYKSKTIKLDGDYGARYRANKWESAVFVHYLDGTVEKVA